MTDEIRNEILDKAKELDSMERSVTTEEANVLERVLRVFAVGGELKIKDCERVEAMYDKYLAPREDQADGPEGLEGEEEIAEGEDELETFP